MDRNTYRGRLERWNDDKGFGFVRPENSSKDIFIHISALKNVSRRPVVGDVISFRVETDDKGKFRAANATIAGIPIIKPRSAKIRGKRKKGRSSPFSGLVLLVVIGVTGYAGFDSWKSRQAVAVSNAGAIVEPVPEKRDNAEGYQCDGRTHCSQMTSCEEAKFFIRNCPNTKMDGDGDRVPCEHQFCGR
ncbi:MAG: cold shock domain-containing protein [Gammaproteobacteria bacterium]|nr:cold shock domain-containing protein [Gammaproteobacteria bacterium]MCF6362889.1 cold shock domain-containing protein [Gammaproteobacteria bacterium]